MSETTTLKTRFGDLRVQKEIMKGNFDNIPIIDLSNLRSPLLDERRELAKRVYDACTNVGFFYVKVWKTVELCIAYFYVLLLQLIL